MIATTCFASREISPSRSSASAGARVYSPSAASLCSSRRCRGGWGSTVQRRASPLRSCARRTEGEHTTDSSATAGVASGAPRLACGKRSALQSTRSNERKGWASHLATTPELRRCGGARSWTSASKYRGKRSSAATSLRWPPLRAPLPLPATRGALVRSGQERVGGGPSPRPAQVGERVRTGERALMGGQARHWRQEPLRALQKPPLAAPRAVHCHGCRALRRPSGRPHAMRAMMRWRRSRRSTPFSAATRCSREQLAIEPQAPAVQRKALLEGLLERLLEGLLEQTAPSAPPRMSAGVRARASCRACRWAQPPAPRAHQ